MTRILLTDLVPVYIKHYSLIDIYIMLVTRSFLYTALILAIVSYLKHLFFLNQCCEACRRTEKHYLIRFLGNLDLGLSLSKTSCKIMVS